jgi:hypothetical protein|nr:MAG TPA: hypothetical protein [Caudoviricetes sp.]
MAVNEIRYKGVSYATDDDIKVPSGILYEVKALRSDSLEANSLTVTVFSNDKAIMGFAKNDKVEYFRNGRRVGVYYLQTVERVGSAAYTLSALSALGRLITMRHVGGIYTGQTVAEVVPQICGPVEVMIESVYASRQLYGYLPYSNPDKEKGNGRSARDNLSQVLFAIGASLGTDENGVMRVEKLWDGVSATITADQINEDSCSTVYETPVSAVEITEHQWVKSQDTVTLFEGTAEDGALVTFEEPAHSLTAEGFAITEQGDNYAILSAGTGTLTGKSYNHLTRIVRRTVTDGAEENVVTVSDATLVSLTNSVDVAKRMADYYRHRETIRVDVEPGTERAGRVVQIFHPWDKKIVQACVESRETVISGILNSQTSALVGFTPAQPESAEYFDERVVLTGSGEWEVPENVTAITAVLIGGAQGGHCGHGGNPAEAKTESYTETILGSLLQHNTDKWALGGKGGKGGDPGSGGKILQATFDVTPAQKFSYVCGVGGFGAAFDANNWANTPNTPGAEGTKTTFGSLDSSTGSTSDIGYTDPVTGEVFAAKGEQGIAGGDGAGMNPNHGDNDRYIPLKSTSVVDEDGHVWEGGATKVNDNGIVLPSAGDEQSFTGDLEEGYCGGDVTYNCGSGAAAGANGNPGNAAGSFRLVAVPSKGMPKTSITVTARGSASVNGADATLVPKKPTVYGKGGRGGYGGGGDGATGLSRTYYGGSKSGTLNNYPGSVRTTGSNGAQGGPGGDGCIILYYRRPKPVQSGALKTSDGRDLLDALDRRMIV